MGRPELLAHGATLLLVGLAMVLVGAIAGATIVVVMGGMVLGVIMWGYLLALDERAAMRDGLVRVGIVPPSGAAPRPVAGRPLELLVVAENHRAHRPFRLVDLEIATSRRLLVAPHGRAMVAPGASRVAIPLTLEAVTSGVWFVFGVTAYSISPFGFFRSKCYFRVDLSMHVLPAAVVLARHQPFGTRRSAQTSGNVSRRERLQGQTTDVKELREHAPGDPLRHIDWKATARRGKLIVRSFEPDVHRNVYFLLDMAASMRCLDPDTQVATLAGISSPGTGAAAMTALDTSSPMVNQLERAIGYVYASSQRLVRERARVGLVCYDSKVFSHLKAQEGSRLLREMSDRLLELHTPVHAYNTEVSMGSLLRRLDEHIRSHRQVRVQGGLDLVRRHRYLLFEYIERHLARRTREVQAIRIGRERVELDGDPDLARLRLFCFMNGIVLPYVHHTPRRAREAGLAAAIEAVMLEPTGPHSVVVVSDFKDMDAVRGRLGGLLTVARRRGNRFVFAVPSAPLDEPSGGGDIMDKLATLLAMVDTKERRGFIASARALGVHFVEF